MTRQTLTAALSPLAGIEASIRQALRALTTLKGANPDLDALQSDLARIRATSRHWLLG